MPDGENADVQEAERWLGAIPEYDWLTTSGQQWHTAAEVSEHIAVAKDAIRRWCERGQIAGAVLYGQQIGWRMPRSGLLLHFARMARGGAGRAEPDDVNGQAG